MFIAWIPKHRRTVPVSHSEMQSRGASPTLLFSVFFRGYAGIPFEIPAKKERVIVPDLLSDLLDGIVAFKQATARVVDSFTSQPVNRS